MHFSIFLHICYICLNIHHDVQQAFVCLSNKNLLPFRDARARGHRLPFVCGGETCPLDTMPLRLTSPPLSKTREKIFIKS